MTIEQIAQEALALPSEQRALLADRLVESLDPAEANRIDQLWATEAKRRRDEVRQGLVQTIPGNEALARTMRYEFALCRFSLGDPCRRHRRRAAEERTQHR